MEALTRRLELLAQLHIDAETRQQEQLEKHRAEMDWDIENMERTLRRAIHMGLRGARNQRDRWELLDGKITQLAAAQLVTEEKLQGPIQALRLGGNGGGRRV